MGDFDTFEVLLGTEDGCIFHACLNFSSKGLTVYDQFVNVLETNDYRAILDLKIARILNK